MSLTKPASPKVATNKPQIDETHVAMAFELFHRLPYRGGQAAAQTVVNATVRMYTNDILQKARTAEKHTK